MCECYCALLTTFMRGAPQASHDSVWPAFEDPRKPRRQHRRQQQQQQQQRWQPVGHRATSSRPRAEMQCPRRFKAGRRRHRRGRRAGRKRKRRGCPLGSHSAWSRARRVDPVRALQCSRPRRGTVTVSLAWVALGIVCGGGMRTCVRGRSLASGGRCSRAQAAICKCGVCRLHFSLSPTHTLSTRGRSPSARRRPGPRTGRRPRPPPST